ncbi:MAG: aminotransferase class III-fold pyridoxal phosphate-dependent enzyme, partial [Mesorhizobium sp.]
FAQHPHVGDIRGRGMLMTLELVQDRETKAPFPAERGVSPQIYREALSRGLITHALGGTVDGVNGDHIVVCPPLIAGKKDLETIVGLLGESVDASLLGLAVDR